MYSSTVGLLVVSETNEVNSLLILLTIHLYGLYCTVNTHTFPLNSCSPTIIYVLGDDYAEVRDPDRQILGQAILPHQVILEERIGEGQFGDVHKGILYPGVSGCGFCCEWV